MMSGIFKSARVKLTLFYLVVIVAFTLLLTIAIRIYAEWEYLRSNNVQRGEVKQLVVSYLDIPGRRPELVFADAQEDEAERVRQHLNIALLMVNVVALTAGGFISYWFAGRTLKPLEEAHEAQARFASDASHELRTPLTNMRLENEIFLRQKTFTEDDAREQISSNLEEVQRLESLASNLLALTQYGQAKLILEPTEVAPLINDAMARMEKTFTAKKVNTQAKAAEARVLVHRESVLQLLSIVLDNAVKYGPEAGQVKLEGRVQGGRYVLSVSDQGPGIDPADLSHIFDRLFRGDKARSSTIPGYGLGLSLAKEIAEANGAEISAANSAKGGAVITLELPLVNGG